MSSTADHSEAIAMTLGTSPQSGYYNCGLAMNTAWGEMAGNPCSSKTWTASDKMKEIVPECSKLRDGNKYMESYRALKFDQDTWCGGVTCSPACESGATCSRDYTFPFEPHCFSSVPRAAMTSQESSEAPKIKFRDVSTKHGILALILTAMLLLVCIGAAVYGWKKASSSSLSSQPSSPQRPALFGR
jgi:hypothetical protein